MHIVKPSYSHSFVPYLHHLTYAEIEERYPHDFKARDEDKYNYRYLGGESYRDVVIRLEPIIMELERSENILIITHQAVLRCIYAYFMGSPQDKSPWMEVPLHTLIRLTPRAYKTEEERMHADVPAVSTWREKGSKAVHTETESSKRGSPVIAGETKEETKD
jgi:6-phosphofructo-2-kinase/fructose-2,6-biphosphatase 2